MNNKTEFFKVEKNKDFTVINNEILKRDDVSWKAKGIMCYLLSLPSDWNINLNEVMKHATDGQRAFRSGWKELTDLGYVERKPVRKGQRIEYWETTIWESLDLKANSLLCGFEDVQNVYVRNEDVQNVKLLNTNNTKDLIYKERIYSAFEEAWLLYPLKRGKNAVNKKNKEAIEKLGKETILKAVRNYILDVENQRANGFKELNFMNGSTFFNGRYEDYLEESSITPLEKLNKQSGYFDGLDLGVTL